jgi:hypothetical protein
MTIFKKLALSAALAVCAVTGAHAATYDEYTTFVLSNSTENTPGVSTGTYLIDSVTGAAPTDAFGNPVPARVAGDTFQDDFLFTIQDGQELSFFATSNPGKFMGFVVPSALLDSITVFDLQGDVYVPEFKLDTLIGFYESGLTLNSGAYDLEITGDLLTNGGGYSGVMTTVPVPEPSGFALMLAGLGAMVTLVRRRNRKG